MGALVKPHLYGGPVVAFRLDEIHKPGCGLVVPDKSAGLELRQQPIGYQISEVAGVLWQCAPPSFEATLLGCADFIAGGTHAVACAAGPFPVSVILPVVQDPDHTGSNGLLRRRRCAGRTAWTTLPLATAERLMDAILG